MSSPPKSETLFQELDKKALAEKRSTLKLIFFRIIFILFFLFKFFNTRIYGVFLLVVLLYFLSPLFLGIKPLNFQGLIIFLIDLPSSYKIALLSSAITIIGFLIAFQTATSNWINQTIASIKLDAAKEIDTTYSRINSLITSVQIYADTHLELIREINQGVPDSSINFKFNFILSKTPEFLSNRSELSALHIKASGLLSRYSNVLFSTWNFSEDFSSVQDMLDKVAEKMWIVVPDANSDLNSYKLIYMKYITEQQLEDLSSQCTESREYIAAVTGSIRGKLTAKLFELNLATILNFWKMGNILGYISSTLKKVDKKYGRTRRRILP